MKRIVPAILIILSSSALAEDWGPYMFFTTNLDIRYVHTNPTTLTWAFKNSRGGCNVEPFTFRYSYIDADTGQLSNSNDVEPEQLTPGKSVGGWQAFTANTRGMLGFIYPSQPIVCD